MLVSLWLVSQFVICVNCATVILIPLISNKISGLYAFLSYSVKLLIEFSSNKTHVPSEWGIPNESLARESNIFSKPFGILLEIRVRNNPSPVSEFI